MERNKTLDIAKGLLMLMVVFGHLTQAARYSNASLGIMEDVVSWYYAFYMGAFFIISGYCYNTDKPFIEKLKQNFCRLLLPAFIFSILSRLIFSIYNRNASPIIDIFSAQYWIDFSDYWFLNALFFSKVWYDILLKYIKNKYLILLIAIPISMVGCFVGSHYGIVVHQKWIPIPNYWCIRSSLVAFLFVVIGVLAKGLTPQKKAVLLGALVYMFLIAACEFFKIEIPIFTWGILIDNWYLFMLLALSGTCFILFVSNLIERNHFLETFGKVSLVIYCVQMVFLKIIFEVLYNNLPIEHNVYSSIFVALLTFVIAVPLMYLLAQSIINHCPFLIGKFQKRA